MTAGLSGGELNAALTSAVVGIHNAYLGRGPASASTMHHGHVFVTILRGVLSRAERELADDHGPQEVIRIRLLLQHAMEAELRTAVERLTGRLVIAFMGGVNVDPDISSMVFVLDGEAPRGAAEPVPLDGETPPPPEPGS